MKKVKNIFKELSEVHYEDSESIIYSTLSELEVNQKERLLSPICEIEKINDDDENEDEYIPQYILEISENLENEFEDIETEMKIEY